MDTSSQKARITSKFNLALVQCNIVQAATIYKDWAYRYQPELNEILDQHKMKEIVFDAISDFGHGYVDQP